MPKLTMLVGPPGSGKSSYAMLNMTILDIYVNQDSQGKDHFRIFEEAVMEGRDIVVDRMNFSQQQRFKYLHPAKASGYTTEIIVLHESYDTCIERIKNRVNHETIKDEATARKVLSFFFSKYERPKPDEADIINFIYPGNYKPKAVICDLDGTLCNVDHRLGFMKQPKKDWKSFFEGIDDDAANLWCLNILDGIERSIDTVLAFASGRPDSYKNETRAWLARHNFYNNLFMRPRNDHRSDEIVKEIILDFEILTRYEPLFFIDDRSRVVDMWRRRGFVCLQCAKGDF